MLTKKRINQIKSFSSKRGRVELGEFIAEGAKMLEEMIRSEFEVVQVFYVSSAEDKVMSIISGENIDAIKIAQSEIERISQLKTASDIVVIVKLPTDNYFDSGNIGGLSIALDSIQDPGNLGTIVRIADWYGIENVFCSENCADLFSPKVVQSTMGAITRVKVHYLDLEQLLSNVKLPIYGTFLEGENIYSQKLTTDGIIVMGNEGNGISEKIGALVTNKVHIPSYPANCDSSESLNVAVATAICVAEFRRLSSVYL